VRQGTKQAAPRFLAGAALGVLAAFGAGTADAQTSETAGKAGDEIVITGRTATEQSVTKSDAPLIETPQSISVITRQALDDQAVESVAQALRYAPGVSSESGGVATRFDSFFARGFALDQYLDGLRPLAGGNSLSQPDPYLLDSIEVLRGPASVLFGQASPGGIVNLVSKRPTVAPIREIQAQVGSYDQYQLGFDIGGAIGGALSARLSGMARESDSQLDFAHEERYALAPSIRWQPDADTSLTFYANYQNDPEVGYNGFIPAHGSVLPNAASSEKLPTSLYTGDPGFDRTSRETFTIGDEFEHRFNDVFTVRQKLRYGTAKADFHYIQSSFLDVDDRTLNRFTFIVDDDAIAWDSDNQLQAKFASGALTHNVLVGLDYQHLRVRTGTGGDFSTAPSLDIFAPVYNVPIAVPPIDFVTLTNQSQIGLYAQDQAALGHWRFLLGGRQDWAKTKSDASIPGLGNVGSQEQKDDAFTWRAGGVYLFENGLAPYASYTESFQPEVRTDGGAPPFEPTTAKQYEIGLKYQAPGSRDLITLALYDLTRDKVVVPDPIDPLVSIQIGQVRSRGVEISGTHPIGERLDLTASYSYVDQEVTVSGDPLSSPPVGSTPAGVPATEASLWLDYHPSGGRAGFGSALGLRYSGASWGDSDNTFKVDGVTLVDAALRYDFRALGGPLSGLELGLNVTNLFDETYVAGCSSLDFCNYGFRRAVIATMRKRF
jgi:iron complex outermembrane receptor protein